MALLLDVGNSAVKWAHLSGAGGLAEPGHQLHRGVADIGAQLAQHWRESVKPGTPVVGCNVAGAEVMSSIENAARGLGLGAVRWLSTQHRSDAPVHLVNGYRDPPQLGSDRWHGMLGACSLPSSARQALVVVNAGTATTVDCIDLEDTEDDEDVGDADNVEANESRPRRRFVGGVIAPGVRLMLESLARGTAGLPIASGKPSDFPDNTDAAIVTGVLDAQAGLVHRVWHRFAVGLTGPPRLILTGGNARILLARLSIEGARIEDNLVLRGLAVRLLSDSTDVSRSR